MKRRTHDDTQAGTRRLGRFVVGILLLAALTMAGPSAWAYWTSSGAGTGSATTATLEPPTGVVAAFTPSLTWVDVSWNAPTTGVAPLGYYVTRTPQGGGPTEAACASSAAAPVTDLACDDEGVATGTYFYTVTSVYRSWTATSEVSNTVAVVIDTTAPTVTGVSSTQGDGSYKAGQIIPVTVTFSEPVFVGGSGTPQLILSTGSPSTTAAVYTSGSGGATLTFNYTVVAGNTSGGLDYATTSALVLNGGSIADAATNAANLTLPAPGTSGSLAANTNLVIDTTAPTVTGVSSTQGDGSYKAGQIIPVTVTFSEPVFVGGSGTPQLILSTGSPSTTAAVYTSGSGGATLTFNYTVVAGNTSGGLDYATTSALVLNGGSIADAATNAANLTLPAPGTSGSLAANTNLVIDTTAPTVTGVSSTQGDGSYKAGQIIPVTVTFSEPVFVGGSGTPQLILSTGSPSTTAAVYTSGSGGATLTFNYTVVAGNTSGGLDYATTSALVLNGGSIADAATNAANLTLPAPGTSGSLAANTNLVIDTTAPTVTGVSSTQGDGSYKAGQIIPVTVTFSEPVFVGGSGTPQLILSTGSPSTTAAVYTSGSGGATLTFNYTVVAGNTSGGLDYASTSALVLNGGSIADAATNAANLTLFAPGTSGSLAANTNLVIDTTAPTVTVTRVNGSVRTFPYISGSNVTSVGGTCGTASGDFAPVTVLVNGSNAGTVNCNAGAWTLSTSWTTDGVRTVSATQSDVATNTGTAPAKTVIVDKDRPTLLSIERAGVSPVVNAGPLTWTATFSEPVSGVAVNNFDIASSGITGTPTITGVSAAGGSPSATWTVTVDVTGVTGTSAGSIGLDLIRRGSVVDPAGSTLRTRTFTGEAYTYDTTSPAAAGVSSALAEGADTTGEIVPVAVTSSEPVAVVVPVAPLGLDDGTVSGAPPAVVVASMSSETVLLGLRVNASGTAEPGSGPLTVYLCNGTEPSCDASTATQTFLDVAIATDGTWLTDWSAPANPGTWYASATQADAAGNVGTSALFGPYTN